MCTKKKFKLDDKKQINLGASVLIASYKNLATEKDKISAIQKALRPLKLDDKRDLPGEDCFVKYLSKLIKYIDKHERPEMTNHANTHVMCAAYDELVVSNQIEGQISVDELCPLEAEPVDDVLCDCVSDDTADETYTSIDVAALSANDKKELVKYIIDQHYFFLKQLTGVI